MGGSQRRRRTQGISTQSSQGSQSTAIFSQQAGPRLRARAGVPPVSSAIFEASALEVFAPSSAFVSFVLFVTFVRQKSYCKVSFAVRAVSTSLGTNHAPLGT